MSNMSDDALRSAAAKLREARIAAQPPLEECKHEFSPEFEQAMDRLMQKGKCKAVWRRVVSIAASLLLVLLIVASITLAVSPAARAAVITWLREQYENSIIYRFWASGDSSEFPTYQVGWLPDGFELLQEIEEEHLYIAIYQSDDGAHQVIFMYHPSNEEDTMIIGGDTDGSERLTIQGLYGEYMPSEDGEKGELIWIDEESQIVFAISADLEKHTIIEVAESVFRAK